MVKKDPLEDDIYPNDGAAFAPLPIEPLEQVNQRKKEKAEFLEALPLVTGIIERFEERITFYSSVDSIPQNILTEPDKFMHVVAANQLAKDNLIAEKEWLEALIDEYKR